VPDLRRACTASFFAIVVTIFLVWASLDCGGNILLHCLGTYAFRLVSFVYHRNFHQNEVLKNKKMIADTATQKRNFLKSILNPLIQLFYFDNLNLEFDKKGGNLNKLFKKHF